MHLLTIIKYFIFVLFRTWLGVFLFSARGFSVGVFQAVYVYTPEVYPTRLRGAVIGIMASASRVGAIITPFIAQVNTRGLIVADSSG